ncbi:hypothetical protein SSX86_020627 [Deinandra increscens subsp. villosa]|uniref:Receptor-like serine/threonine-protein kinase n=1 Tax=Deinandra increscens subsp. villosa TaxID=3103831 RepID=A0AAP0GQZ7_9ASTR
MKEPWICYCFALFLFLNCYSTTAQPPFVNSSVNLPTTWSNTESLPNYFNFTDGSFVQVILLRESLGPQFACGFFCNGTCISYLFVVFIIHTTYRVPLSEGGFVQVPTRFPPQVVWSANRDRPVSSGAILNLTITGELVLQDVDGSTVWTTNTTGKSVVGLNLTDDGNLVLFDINNSTVWQSFDYPTDCLVPGQALFEGQQLIPSVSSTDWMAQKDSYSLKVTDKGLVAYVGSNPPQAYHNILIDDVYVNSDDVYDKYIDTTRRRYVRFLNGNLSLFIHSVEPSDPLGVITIPKASSAQYMKLMPDGHLRVFQWKAGWSEVADLLTGDYFKECNYPMTCGRYGICLGNQQCSCLVSTSSNINYFRETKGHQPNLGCSEITTLTCNATQDQLLIELGNIGYFTFIRDMKNVDLATCKQACLNNCSCKAALFQYGGSDSSSGYCSLPSEVFTMMIVEPDLYYYNNISAAFLKVQNVRSLPASGSKSQSTLRVILASTIGSSMFLFGAIGFVIYVIRKRRWATQMEEEYIDEVPEMPTRFSYEELKPATKNFNKKLGEGGFGAVYEGTLEDGSMIAVKCLEGLGQVNKSFLAEVKSIGSIHHVNLVRLRGFCAWKSQRFLVYEFMSKGSLDRWIYHGNREHVLEWECRKKIILDVAKGLAYLHDDCRQKIIHLDIKPQNILLDKDFNAKVSDFGLSKLIERNQTEVMTTMRGTLGYLAPEWLGSVITEKVDVYSFGIVFLEILCGRKNFDRSQPEESWHLLVVLQKCWEQGTLVDMVDKYSEDMQTRAPEVVEMLKVASWCLQCDFTKRPSMSIVVKVLEGVMKVESSLDYNFTDPRLQKITVEDDKDTTTLFPSVLSGPR